MKEMTTKEEFYEYLKNNKTGMKNLIGTVSPKYQFAFLEKQLLKDEYAICCFVLQINEFSITSKNNVSGALTNKRLIISKNNIVKNEIISISINNINDIYIKNKIVQSFLIIDTLKETIELTGNREYVENTYKLLHESLNEVKNNLITNDTEPLNTTSKYDELSKIKELLDNGILTQEEFNTEKEKILNK